MIELGIVVPCFNEEAVLPETAKRLLQLITELRSQGKIDVASTVWFVDDGSRDGTWGIIKELANQHESIHGIKLSRNRGHQNALLAGLFNAPGDAIVTVDADLQDDLGAIGKMLDAHERGAQIVYGVRKSRQTDSRFKRVTAESYYRLLALLGVEIVFNHADYRLMSRRAIEALQDFGEVNLFLRGIIPQLGFATAVVEYDRTERFAGESKYPLKKMLSLAIQGITSFSPKPLRMITMLGILISAMSFLIGLWVLWIGLVTELAVPGWTSTLLPIYFLGGIQLLGMGVIGEYVAKIYTETKGRPRYTIDRIV